MVCLPEIRYGFPAGGRGSAARHEGKRAAWDGDHLCRVTLSAERKLRRAQGIPAAGMIALALGAAAFGAVAVGALAIGRLALGRVTVKRARFEALEVDELTVRKLRVREYEGPPPQA